MNSKNFRTTTQFNHEINSNENIQGKNILTNEEYSKRVNNILQLNSFPTDDEINRLSQGIGIYLGHYSDIYNHNKKLNKWSNYKIVNNDINNFLIKYKKSEDFYVRNIIEDLEEYQEFIINSNLDSPKGLGKLFRLDEDKKLEDDYKFKLKSVIHSINKFQKNKKTED